MIGAPHNVLLSNRMRPSILFFFRIILAPAGPGSLVGLMVYHHSPYSTAVLLSTPDFIISGCSCMLSVGTFFPPLWRWIRSFNITCGPTFGFFKLLLLFLKILFIFRERGREGEEGEKHQRVTASSAPPAGDLAHNPGMCPDWELNWWPLGSQTSTQSTEPHQPGL